MILDFFHALSTFGTVLYHSWWFIFPPMFYYIFEEILWIDYVLVYAPNSHVSGYRWSLLEIIPPKDIERGPKVMESIYTGLAGVVAGTDTFSKYMKGSGLIQDRFSLELVGEAGRVHFYIRCQKKYRNLVEAQVYAQYPDAEVNEVEDYTQRFPKILPTRSWDLWGTDFEFVAKDSAPIPIKTYDKFEEDITGTMIDPVAALVEVLGTLPPGQHIWLQYVLEPLPEVWAKDQIGVLKKLKGETVTPPKGILDDLIDIFGNIFRGMWGEIEFAAAEKKDQAPLEFRLSPLEKDRLKAVEENLGKNFFKTKMRMVYLGRKEGFEKSFISSFIGALKQFNDINYNQFKPEDVSKTYGKIFGIEARAEYRKRKIYDRYRRRNMDDMKLFFSTKELATLFHFPDISVKSPAVMRVASKLGVAPPNLPIQ